MRLSYERRRVLLLAGVLICGAATSLAQTETTPGSSTPGQAIPGTTGVSPFAGSVPARLVPGVLALSLRDAIDRGLRQNLGLLLSKADVRSARGRARVVKKGYTLRVQVPAPFRLHWTGDEWGTVKDTPSSATTLGIDFVDIPITGAQHILKESW